MITQIEVTKSHEILRKHHIDFEMCNVDRQGVVEDTESLVFKFALHTLRLSKSYVLFSQWHKQNFTYLHSTWFNLPDDALMRCDIGQIWYAKINPALREIISIIDPAESEPIIQDEHQHSEYSQENELCDDAAMDFNALNEENEELKREKQRLSEMLLLKDKEISDLTGTNVLLNQANRLQNELLEAKDQNIALFKKSLGITV